MHNHPGPCPRILTYKPPRIAMTLLLTAGAMQILLPAGLVQLPASIPGGIAVSVTGFLVMLRAWWLFRIESTAVCPTAASTTLVTHDIYRFTRNPMYLGIVMMMAGLALATGALMIYAAMIVFFAVIDHSFCPYEEEKLAHTFPADYKEYAARVRRWL
jgi:protein-S-isoprenylcysteine O-methyltransferase Ste14